MFGFIFYCHIQYRFKKEMRISNCFWTQQIFTVDLIRTIERHLKSTMQQMSLYLLRCFLHLTFFSLNHLYPYFLSVFIVAAHIFLSFMFPIFLHSEFIHLFMLLWLSNCSKIIPLSHAVTYPYKMSFISNISS